MLDIREPRRSRAVAIAVHWRIAVLTITAETGTKWDLHHGRHEVVGQVWVAQLEGWRRPLVVSNLLVVHGRSVVARRVHAVEEEAGNVVAEESVTRQAVVAMAVVESAGRAAAPERGSTSLHRNPERSAIEHTKLGHLSRRQHLHPNLSCR